MANLNLHVVGSFFIVSLCLLVPLASSTSTDVNYCNKKTAYAVNVGGLDISPYPISRGVETTFQIAASTDNERNIN
ncbi:hypothetical protein Leryth_008827 [Lithospermum erythrorhizon]|nr:hypothetical protein Leryth_008827 [Lithospermum erythrorhizon]